MYNLGRYSTKPIHTYNFKNMLGISIASNKFHLRSRCYILEFFSETDVENLIKEIILFRAFLLQ